MNLPAATAQLALFDVAERRRSVHDTLRELWWGEAGRWSQIWRVPDLRDCLRVEVSRRMRTSLGSYFPGEQLIRIADVLFEAPPHLLREVVCHEAAHAAVQFLHGGSVRPHGREWRQLMQRADLDPRVRIPDQELGSAAQRAARKRYVWEHRCPVCLQRRLAGRPVRQWRCRVCVAAGLAGRLVISRRPTP